MSIRADWTMETDIEREALLVVERFKKAFDAADAPAVAALFTPDAVFLGTSMAEPSRGAAKVLEYFRAAMSVNLPKGIEFDGHEVLTLADGAILLAGSCTYFHTREGRRETAKARFTLALVKGAHGWAIAHFHSSMRPSPP